MELAVSTVREFNGLLNFEDGTTSIVKRCVVLPRYTVVLEIEVSRGRHVASFLGVTGMKFNSEISTAWTDLDATDAAREELGYPCVQIEISQIDLVADGLFVRGNWEEWIEDGWRDTKHTIIPFHGTLSSLS